MTGDYRGHEFAEFTYGYFHQKFQQKGLPEVLAVTVIRLPGRLPRIQVSPEYVAASLLPERSWYAVDLESEAFNRTYRVQAIDRRIAMLILGPRAMQTLLDTRPFTWRIDGRDLIAFDKITRGPQEILDRLRTLSIIAENIPASRTRIDNDGRRTGPYHHARRESRAEDDRPPPVEYRFSPTSTAEFFLRRDTRLGLQVRAVAAVRG